MAEERETTERAWIELAHGREPRKGQRQEDQGKRAALGKNRAANENLKGSNPSHQGFVWYSEAGVARGLLVLVVVPVLCTSEDLQAFYLLSHPPLPPVDAYPPSQERGFTLLLGLLTCLLDALSIRVTAAVLRR